MKLPPIQILVVDDDTDVLTAVSYLLRSTGATVTTEKNPEQIPSLLATKKFDVILLDMNFKSVIHSGNEGIYWLQKIKSKYPDTSVIMITAYGAIDLAIRSLKEGATDFIVKPWNNEKLLQTIYHSIPTTEKTKKQNTKHSGNTTIIGQSEVLQEVFLKIEKVAPTDANILILGENGTGKDLIAKAIHEQSLRNKSPFIKVDVGALTESLFESELFGYKKGAFTDAKEDRLGRFEAANGGTLFLDEIGNISLQQQAKLLTVLQNRQVTKLGSNEPTAIDIRLICATNISIQELSNESKFRKDLIYRINTVEIIIPPLRNRQEDIVPLANYFLDLYSQKYLKPPSQLHQSAIKKLQQYTFPGNVRELQYIIERAVIMADSNMITEQDIIYSPIEKTVEIEKSDTLSNVEKKAILKAIENNNGNISKAAKELGITRTALYRRLNKYDID